GLRGRARGHHRQALPWRAAGAGRGSGIRLHLRERRHRAGPAGQGRAVDPGQGLRHVLPARAVDGDRDEPLRPRAHHHGQRRDPALRSWPVLLLVALVCVPPIALIMLNHPTEAKIRDIAWIFAVYFAVAWLLLLGVIVRPQHVSRAMLAAVAVVGIVTQAPTAIFLETQLHAGTSSLLD